MKENEFSAVMAKRSNVDLIEIVTKLKDDYQPDAILAAKNEIENRNLDIEVVKAAEIEIEEKHKELERKSNEPLDTHWRVLCLIFPGIMNLFLAFIFKGQGEERKFKETWRWTFYGVCFYVGIVVLMFVLVGLLT